MSGSGTEKQQAARLRNWHILRLRGIYYSIDSEAIRAAVDFELDKLGAEPEGVRRIKRLTEAYGHAL